MQQFDVLGIFSMPWILVCAFMGLYIFVSVFAKLGNVIFSILYHTLYNVIFILPIGDLYVTSILFAILVGYEIYHEYWGDLK